MNLLERLSTETILADGAMGTMLQRQNLHPDQSGMQLNITAPEIIEDTQSHQSICSRRNSPRIH